MSTKEIAMEKGIPVPKNPLSIRWPLKDMPVGFSFAIPRGRRTSVASKASRNAKETGKEFTIRTITNKETGKKEVRCWRIK